jgi:hypothetical protein
MDFQHSPRSQELLEPLAAFQEREIGPREEPYHRELLARADPWVVLPAIDELKEKAKAEGLWNCSFQMSSTAPVSPTSSTRPWPSGWAAR